MSKVEQIVSDKYFEWMYNYVCEGKTNQYVSYYKLFDFLYNTEFVYPIDRDVNRAMDGEELRYRFIEEYPEYDMSFYVLFGPCSVLEMILALAIRCEETIMDNSEFGNRTIQWFWNMLGNLGIGYMTDDMFDSREAQFKIDRFLTRNYEPNGEGGLFYISKPYGDMREEEIWTQMMWYLENFI